MEKGKGVFYRWHWFLNILKNGLFWFGLRNRLAKIGFDLDPYYLEIEGLSQGEESTIKDDKMSYRLERLEPGDIRKLSERIVGLDEGQFYESLEKNPICIGLRHEAGKIAAYMLIDIGAYHYKNRVISLKDNEAYLQGMYTFEDYRGNNLAPYLRYKSYELLMAEGKDRLYSITSYFNKSSLKFKKKLGVKHLSLRLSIVLFRRWYWDFRLKKYNS